MNCPDCNAEFEDVRQLLAENEAGAERVPWYKFAGPAKLRCPECGTALKQRTLAASIAIALTFLVVFVLKVAMPDNGVIDVMFWTLLVVACLVIPVSLKWRVRLVRDDS